MLYLDTSFLAPLFVQEATSAKVDAEFEAVVDESFRVLTPGFDDFELSKTYLRRYETGLRTIDALHLAIAANNRARAVYTLDLGLQRAGRMLGLPVRSGIRLE